MDLPPKGLPRAPIFQIDYINGPIKDRLKKYRQNAELTLEALSLVTKGVDPEGKGISRVSLSRYESGSEPGLRELKILSWAFRKPLALIVYGDQDPISFRREPFDMMLEDIISETVLSILENRGLVKKEESDDDNSYKQLIETARKLAK